jgi:hypothetical protein
MESFREMLCAVFCASAEEGIPVERALALVNAEIDRVLAETVGSREGTQALKRLVMVCCLDCYYPENPHRERHRESA